MTEVDRRTVHEWTPTHDARDLESAAFVDRRRRHAPAPKPPVKPHSWNVRSSRLPNDLDGYGRTGCYDDTVKLPGDAREIRIACDLFDLRGVGIHGEHLVPAIPQLSIDGIRSAAPPSRYARNGDPPPAQEGGYEFRNSCHKNNLKFVHHSGSAVGRAAAHRLKPIVRPQLGLATEQTSTAFTLLRVARSSRDIGQPDHSLVNTFIAYEAERWLGSSEVWLAVTKYDGMQVDSILIDQAKLAQTVRQIGTANVDFPVALVLQPSDRALEIVRNKLGVGPNRLQRARDNPFRLVPPRRCKGVFLCVPFRMLVVPVTHDLIDSAAVHTARLRLNLLDEVAK